jgi:hypothetical protein
MNEKPSNHGQPWSLQDVVALKKLVARKASPKVIAFELGRAEDVVKRKAAELHVETSKVNGHR